MPKIEIVSFGGFRGPRIRGSIQYKLPQEPLVVDGITRISAGVEGGKYDNINMYDGAGISIGIFQWTAKANHVARLLHTYDLEYPSEYDDDPFVKELFDRGVEVWRDVFVYSGTNPPKKIGKADIVNRICPPNGKVNASTEKTVKKIALAAYDTCQTKQFQDVQDRYAAWQIMRYMEKNLDVPYEDNNIKRKWKLCEALGFRYNGLGTLIGDPLKEAFSRYELAMFYFGMNVNAPAIAKKYITQVIKELGYRSLDDFHLSTVYTRFVEKCDKSTYGVWGEKKAKKAGRKCRTQKVLDAIQKLKEEITK